VKRLVDKDKVNVMYCDPPYNISLDYDKGFGAKSKYGGQVNDSKSEREYRNLIAGTIENGIAFLKKDAHVFYYCDENYIWLIQQSYRDLGIKLKRVALWIKNNQNPTPDSAFNKAYEPCVYGTMGNPYLAPINNLTEVMNREVGNGNDTIEDITNISNLWLAKRLPTTTYEHPTEKPPTLHEKPLLRCSKSGDVVLDLFGGSGSTLIACEQLKRKCLMVEMSPTFCDVIIRRYEALTKTKAIKIEEV
jgi:DNA modification methylase